MVHEFKQTWMGRKLVRRTGWHYVPTLSHWCPACEEVHDFAVEQPFTNGAKWTWNGIRSAPSFEPSMNIRVGPYPEGLKETGMVDICHYFLRNGQIQFLPDCTHSHAGKTVPLPDIPAETVGKFTPIEGDPNDAS